MRLASAMPGMRLIVPDCYERVRCRPCVRCQCTTHGTAVCHQAALKTSAFVVGCLRARYGGGC